MPVLCYQLHNKFQRSLLWKLVLWRMGAKHGWDASAWVEYLENTGKYIRRKPVTDDAARYTRSSSDVEVFTRLCCRGALQISCGAAMRTVPRDAAPDAAPESEPNVLRSLALLWLPWGRCTLLVLKWTHIDALHKRLVSSSVLWPFLSGLLWFSPLLMLSNILACWRRGKVRIWPTTRRVLELLRVVVLFACYCDLKNRVSLDDKRRGE